MRRDRWIKRIWIIITILLLLLLTWSLVRVRSLKKEHLSLNNSYSELLTESSEKERSLITMTDSIKSLKTLLSNCEDGKKDTVLIKKEVVEKKSTASGDAIKKLERRVTSLEGKYTKLISDNQKKKVDVVEVRSNSSDFQIYPSVSSSYTEGMANNSGELDLTIYRGKIEGAYGVTINDAGFITYFYKAAYRESPYVFATGDRSGPEFSYDQASGYWYYVSGSKATLAQINNRDMPLQWAIYVGEVVYNQASGESYSAYLPHETLKPLLKEVKGVDWGPVNESDLQQMFARNSNIRCTSNPYGSISPQNYNVSGATKVGSDGKTYLGWNFISVIIADIIRN